MKHIIFIIAVNIAAISIIRSQPIHNVDDSDVSFQTFRSSNVDCEREQIIENYLTGYINTNISTDELAWTGDVDQCNEGSISSIALEKTKNRINYFRNLVGIPNGVIFSDVKNEKCQKAVLMMNAARELDHYPTADWLCSSDEGIEAAGKSNLSYGAHSSGSVPQYIRDSGSGNGAVGHRRWILYPKAYEFGFGSTNWGTSMWVIGGTQNPEFYPEFVAYPSPGYFPKNLIYPRWSFSKKSAKYDEAIITMYNEAGEVLTITVEEVTNGFGDNTLVWVPEINLYDISLGSDSYFKVKIENVKIGTEYEDFEYEVLGIIPETTENPISVINPSCTSANGSASLNILTGYKSIKWSNGAENIENIEALNAGQHSVTITDKLGCEQIMEFQLLDENPPNVISSINGNVTPAPNESETYSTESFSNGDYSWSITGGEIISGAASNEVEVMWDESSTAGEVCVSFSDSSDCISNEFCIQVEMTLSSSFDLSASHIKINPNPFSDYLAIDIPAGESLESLEIVKYDGALIQKIVPSNTSGKLVVNTNALQNGLYIIKLNLKNGVVVKKIIKQ